MYQLSTEVLGVSPLAPGFTHFRVAPQPAELTAACGVFPTIRGDVEVAWQWEARTIVLDLVVPEGTRAAVVAPSGYRLDGASDALGPGTHRVRFLAV